MDNHRFPERQRPEFRILLQRPDCSVVLGVGSLSLQLRGGWKEQRGSVRWRSGSDLGSEVFPTGGPFPSFRVGGGVFAGGPTMKLVPRS